MLFKQLQGSWPSSSPFGRSPVQCHTTTGVSLLRMQMQLPLSREKSLRLSGHQQECQAPESQAFCDPVTANPSSFAALLSLQISIVFFFLTKAYPSYLKSLKTCLMLQDLGLYGHPHMNDFSAFSSLHALSSNTVQGILSVEQGSLHISFQQKRP